MIGLSTAWAEKDFTSILDVFKAAQSLGISQIEIGVPILDYTFDEIKKAQDFGLEIKTVHNICTEKKIDKENVRGDFISSLKKKKRKKAVALTIDTINFAYELGARIVIIHLGKIELHHAKRKQIKLFKYLEKFGMITEEYEHELQRFRDLRNREFPEYFGVIIDVIREILKNTPDDMLLAFENRYFLNEIPTVSDLRRILDFFKSDRLKFWYDTGHGKILEYLGVYDEMRWFEEFESQLIGFHLHDSIGYKDHMPPGKGNYDFKKLDKYLKDDKYIKILEPAAGWPKEAIAESLNILQT